MGKPRKGQQMFQSLSHIWRRLLPPAAGAEETTSPGLGYSTSHPTPSPVHRGKGTSANQNSLHP